MFKGFSGVAGDRQKLRVYKVKQRKTKLKENISMSNDKHEDLNQLRTARKRG